MKLRNSSEIQWAFPHALPGLPTLSFCSWVLVLMMNMFILRIQTNSSYHWLCAPPLL